MRKLAMGSLVLIIYCLLAPPVSGLGGIYSIGPDAKGTTVLQQPDWPVGLADLINGGPVFYGHWVNANSEFFFLGDTGALTRFLERYSTLKDTPLVVIIHAGSERRSQLWGDKPDDRYDWKVFLQKRGWGAPEKPLNQEGMWVVTVDVWIDHDIQLANLVVPPNVELRSAGEIETFITKHRGAHPAGTGDK